MQFQTNYLTYKFNISIISCYNQKITFDIQTEQDLRTLPQKEATKLIKEYFLNWIKALRVNYDCETNKPVSVDLMYANMVFFRLSTIETIELKDNRFDKVLEVIKHHSSHIPFERHHNPTAFDKFLKILIKEPNND